MVQEVDLVVVPEEVPEVDSVVVEVAPEVVQEVVEVVPEVVEVVPVPVVPRVVPRLSSNHTDMKVCSSPEVRKTC